MLPAERPSGEVNAAVIDRFSTGEHETDDMLTVLRHASRTPSAYRASTETGAEAMVSVMITMAGGLFVIVPRPFVTTTYQPTDRGTFCDSSISSREAT